MSQAQTIAVLGASGVFARHLLPRLASSGYPIRAIVRRPESAGVARACGAEIRIADLFHGPALTEALRDADVCVNIATRCPDLQAVEASKQTMR